jgi:hypothetical protein
MSLKPLRRQGVHAVAMQPEKPHGELTQIVAMRSNGQLSGATERVGRLLLQCRSHAFHFAAQQIDLVALRKIDPYRTSTR